MKTVKMTRAQLREAIIKKRGEGELREVLDYLGDMNAAIEMLRELPGSGMVYLKGLVQVWFCVESVAHGASAPIGKEAEAIACAWWQYKTGEVVEICE